MAYIYCPSCGARSEYTLSKPKFCMNCGESLDKSSTAKEVASKDLSTEGAGQESVPNLSSLAYEVVYDSADSPTIGAVAQGLPPINSSKRVPYKSKTGDVIQDSVEFCKSSKSKDIDSGAE